MCLLSSQALYAEHLWCSISYREAVIYLKLTNAIIPFDQSFLLSFKFKNCVHRIFRKFLCKSNELISTVISLLAVWSSVVQNILKMEQVGLIRSETWPTVIIHKDSVWQAVGSRWIYTGGWEGGKNSTGVGVQAATEPCASAMPYGGVFSVRSTNMITVRVYMWGVACGWYEVWYSMQQPPTRRDRPRQDLRHAGAWEWERNVASAEYPNSGSRGESGNQLVWESLFLTPVSTTELIQ